jgi:tripartite-type tricarboxylate transporter receptor subunit TctC
VGSRQNSYVVGKKEETKMNKNNRGSAGARGWARRLAMMAGMVLLAPAIVLAQAYPTRPIRLVVPFGAGGAVDIVARVIGKELTTRLHQTVVVENRTGASGNIAASFVAKSDPDGYTLLMASTGNSVNSSLYSQLNYDPDHDFVQIALVGTVPTVLLANPKLPVNNVQELIALARAKPDSLNFASGGAGTTEHLAAAMFDLQAGTEIKHIPYRGGAPAMADLIAGQVQLMFTNQLNALPFLKAGSLKALGMASEKRSPELPNVPTLIEQGMPGFTASVWWGIFGPAKMPAAVVTKINDAVNAATSSPEVVAQLGKLGATALHGTPEQFAAFYAKESQRWGTTVKEAHIKAD